MRTSWIDFCRESVASRTRRPFIWTLGSGPIGLGQAQTELLIPIGPNSLTLLATCSCLLYEVSIPLRRYIGSCTYDKFGPSIEFRNSLVLARNAVPKYDNNTEKQSMRCAPSKETKPS
jgi:hypothetical protein